MTQEIPAQLPLPNPENLSFLDKLADVGTTLKKSWENASLWGKTTLGLAMGAQIYERARIPEIIAPPIAVEVYLNTGSAAKTALALGGLVAGQQFIIGATWAEALTSYGEVAEKVGKNFPKTVELAEDIGPEKDRKWHSNIREGFAGYFNYGTTPFLVAQKTYEPTLSRKKAHLTSARITGSIGLAGVVVGKTLVEIIEELPPQYQDDAINIAESPLTWISLAAAFEGPRLIGKRLKRRKDKKDETNDSSNLLVE